MLQHKKWKIHLFNVSLASELNPIWQHRKINFLNQQLQSCMRVHSLIKLNTLTKPKNIQDNVKLSFITAQAILFFGYKLFFDVWLLFRKRNLPKSLPNQAKYRCGPIPWKHNLHFANLDWKKPLKITLIAFDHWTSW